MTGFHCPTTITYCLALFSINVNVSLISSHSNQFWPVLKINILIPRKYRALKSIAYERTWLNAEYDALFSSYTEKSLSFVVLLVFCGFFNHQENDRRRCRSIAPRSEPFLYLTLKVPKRENFSLAFFALSKPIWVCDLRSGEKNRFFIKWSLISKVYGFLPHTECAVNKKRNFKLGQN